MNSEIVLQLDHGPGNPRNSEGSFAALAGGRLMFAYSHYEGESGSDHGKAVIAARYSDDGGATWSSDDRVLVPNEGRCNVMSVSLLRLQDGRLALFYVRKNSFLDCRPRLRMSSDDGETWDDPRLCVPAPGYFVLNNDRAIQLRSGRIVLPVALHRAKLDTEEMVRDAFDSRAIAMFFFSDDGGETWQESDDWWALPVQSTSGLQEPGVIECLDGSLYAWCRTSTGFQWELRSMDQGKTWSAPERSDFVSPCAPLSMKRNPADNRLLAVWVDQTYANQASDRASWGRTPLVIACSGDDGKTWTEPQVIEDDPDHGYCYTAIHFTADDVLLAYCCGGGESSVLQDTCIRNIPLAELPATE